MVDCGIKIDNISRFFINKKKKIKALDYISMEIEPGQSVFIGGASGTGKTTLLRLIGLLDDPSSGKIFINGLDATAIKERKKALLRRKTIGFVFQDYNLLPELTCIENAALPLIINGFSKKQSYNKASSILENLGLDDKIHGTVNCLSGGEMQRVAIARALVTDPEILLADEPTGNLDQDTEDKIFDYLLEYHHKRKGITILVSHNQDLMNKTDTAVILKKVSG